MIDVKFVISRPKTEYYEQLSTEVNSEKTTHTIDSEWHKSTDNCTSLCVFFYLTLLRSSRCLSTESNIFHFKFTLALSSYQKSIRKIIILLESKKIKYIIMFISPGATSDSPRERRNANTYTSTQQQ